MAAGRGQVGNPGPPSGRATTLYTNTPPPLWGAETMQQTRRTKQPLNRLLGTTKTAPPGPNNMKKPSSISELLASHGAKLKSLQQGAEAADRVLGTVRAGLPADCSASIWAASLKGGHLTIMLASPSDATRLHYALPGLRARLAGELTETVEKITLRVRPAPETPGG